MPAAGAKPDRPAAPVRSQAGRAGRPPGRNSADRRSARHGPVAPDRRPPAAAPAPGQVARQPPARIEGRAQRGHRDAAHQRLEPHGRGDRPDRIDLRQQLRAPTSRATTSASPASRSSGIRPGATRPRHRDAVCRSPRLRIFRPHPRQQQDWSVRPRTKADRGVVLDLAGDQDAVTCKGSAGGGPARLYLVMPAAISVLAKPARVPRRRAAAAPPSTARTGFRGRGRNRCQDRRRPATGGHQRRAQPRASG